MVSIASGRHRVTSAIEANPLSLLVPRQKGNESWRCRDGASHPSACKAATKHKADRTAGIHRHLWLTARAFTASSRELLEDYAVNGTTVFLLLFLIRWKLTCTPTKTSGGSAHCPSFQTSIEHSVQHKNKQILLLKPFQLNHYKPLVFPCHWGL